MPSSRPFSESNYCSHGPMRRSCTFHGVIASVMIQPTLPSETVWQHNPQMQTGGASQSMVLECMLLATDWSCQVLPRATHVVHIEQWTHLSMASSCSAAAIIGLSPIGCQAFMCAQLCEVCLCPQGQHPLTWPGFAHYFCISPPQLSKD